MLKLGSVSYINALPLTFFLDPKEFEITHTPPAQLFNLLNQGKVDAALLPIVNYFENRDLYLIPNLSIGAKGAVNSVKLFVNSNELNIENINNIYLDKESRTSQLLLKVLLRDRYHRSLEEINFISDPNDPKIEGKLLIGDKALSPHPAYGHPLPKGEGLGVRGENNFDLSQLWTEWTQKPFVFAAWMTKNKDLTRLPPLLQKSRDEGLQKLEQIIQTIPSYSPFLLNQYFTKNLHYYMGPEELEGIKTFYQFLKTIEGYSDELDFRFVS